VTAGDDNLIKIWDIKGNLLHSLKGHKQKVWDVAISPIPPTHGSRFKSGNPPNALPPLIKGGEGGIIVSASEDKTVKVWNLNGNLLQTLQGHQDAVRTVITNGKQIISGSEDHSIKIWDLAGRIVTTLKKHQTAVKGISVSPNQQYLSSVDDDGKIIFWQPNNQTWEYIKTIQGHNNSIWSVTFSPDSQTLATAGEDAKIILWNLNNIRHLNSLQYGCNWIKAYLQHSPEVVCKS
jgi:WD40 repeat protein